MKRSLSASSPSNSKRSCKRRDSVNSPTMPKSTNNVYYQQIEKNLNILQNEGALGLTKINKANVKIQSNKYAEATLGYKNYHYILNVPYAGNSLKWEIIFDPEDWTELPDFDFNDNTFLPEPDLNYIAENVPSWNTWDISDSNALLIILNEFLALYKKSQVEKLAKENKYSSLKLQYEQLLNALNISPNDVDIRVETKNESLEEALTDNFVAANFLIFLPVDLSVLPENEESSTDDYVHLIIQVKKLDNTQTKTSLNVYGDIEQKIGKIKLPKINDEYSLAEYTLLVQKTIDDQIETIVERHKVSKDFMLALRKEFADTLIDFQEEKCKKISFLYELNENYSCLITLQINAKFPQDRPRLTLHSLNCQSGKSCSQSSLISYDSDSSVEENIHLIKANLSEEVYSFKSHSH